MRRFLVPSPAAASAAAAAGVSSSPSVSASAVPSAASSAASASNSKKKRMHVQEEKEADHDDDVVIIPSDLEESTRRRKRARKVSAAGGGGGAAAAAAPVAAASFPASRTRSQLRQSTLTPAERADAAPALSGAGPIGARASTHRMLLSGQAIVAPAAAALPPPLSAVLSSSVRPTLFVRLADVELQCIFVCLPLSDVSRCWRVCRRWQQVARGLTMPFFQRHWKGGEVPLRLPRALLFALMASRMRLLVTDLAVLAPAHRGDDAVRAEEGLQNTQHSLSEWDEEERSGAGSALDPNSLSLAHLSALATALPHLRHLTAKLDALPGEPADSDEEDEDETRADADAEPPSPRLGPPLAVQAYRFPRGLLTLRLSPIGTDSRTRWLLRQLVSDTASLSSLHHLTITLRDVPHSRDSLWYRVMHCSPRALSLPSDLLAPLEHGAARLSLRVLRLNHQWGDLAWRPVHIRSVRMCPSLEHLDLGRFTCNGLGSCLSALTLGASPPVHLRSFAVQPQIDAPMSSMVARLTGLRELDCRLRDDAAVQLFQALTQLEDLTVDCWEEVSPQQFATALSHCTRMRRLSLAHFSMCSAQLSELLSSMPALHTLSLVDCNGLEDFAALSLVPHLAHTLHTLRIDQNNSRARPPLRAQQHLSHLTQLPALKQLHMHFQFEFKPADAWIQMQRTLRTTRPTLNIT